MAQNNQPRIDADVLELNPGAFADFWQRHDPIAYAPARRPRSYASRTLDGFLRSLEIIGAPFVWARDKIRDRDEYWIYRRYLAASDPYVTYVSRVRELAPSLAAYARQRRETAAGRNGGGEYRREGIRNGSVVNVTSPLNNSTIYASAIFGAELENLEELLTGTPRELLERWAEDVRRIQERTPDYIM